MIDPESLDWNKGEGLLPAVVQDAATGRVLMLGYMNREALEHTQASGQVTFYSRSRGERWTKGETSGNVLDLVDIDVDCDHDTLLVLAHPQGPTCHLGTQTCFGDAVRPALAFLGELDRVVRTRRDADPDSSYTARLLSEGAKRCAQKVGEEGVEVALAAAGGDAGELIDESADLLYHLLVAWSAAGVEPAQVFETLIARHSGRD